MPAIDPMSARILAVAAGHEDVAAVDDEPADEDEEDERSREDRENLPVLASRRSALALHVITFPELRGLDACHWTTTDACPVMTGLPRICPMTGVKNWNR